MIVDVRGMCKKFTKSLKKKFCGGVPASSSISKHHDEIIDNVLSASHLDMLESGNDDITLFTDVDNIIQR